MNPKKQHRIMNNEYLMLNMISYLSAKDLVNISQINKKFYLFSNKFNLYWQSACQDYFSQPFEHNYTR